ncbi:MULTISPECIES: ADP-ribosylglycohydrolase family protein [unclassified Anabaena]|uniref:ADP-ribosylglycohydrolase family protein n=1 Tax=unclassified Anabaena TaxID=2619674 RepID=UPI001448898A|nr:MULTISPECIES: ADP-ribosylglycohydrolase family protein [unclassified Anabaena]MTJ10271.1 ADP-ribosylglycohydrolase family protein [Anabaena sp. UHCC 0204]MTJ51310.1 ADP-ribosylglycohydrolase family protein [Anabaena sp. UHCC 0253]
MSTATKVLSGLMGVCVGDALGVPVEFTSRAERMKSPVTTMLGYGTWNQPPGTWSDDSSLMFCLAASLCSGYSLDDIATSFCSWYRENYWTAHGNVFDIGNTTYQAIINLEKGILPLEAGGRSEKSNGNGSLMRILPMAYLHETLSFPELINRVHQVSCITHGHLRSQMACGIYISMAIELLKGADLLTAYLQGVEQIQKIYNDSEYFEEKSHFQRVFSGKIAELPIEEINSGGYVIDTLEASIWCLLNSSSYAESVLKAVNLGGDTDTTAAVTGGLAGIYYGVENIPPEWVEQIARKQDIIDLASRFAAAL